MCVTCKSSREEINDDDDAIKKKWRDLFLAGRSEVDRRACDGDPCVARGVRDPLKPVERALYQPHL